MRVDVGRQCETITIGALDQVKHHRSVTLGNHIGHFIQMLCPACGDGIGEFGKTWNLVIAFEVDILDLDITKALVRIGQQDIDPGILAVFMLGLFWKKATNKGAIIGALISIPTAMLLKVGSKKF